MEKHQKMASTSPSPQDWPLYRKLRASATSFFAIYTLLFNSTAYSTAVAVVAPKFGVSMTAAIVPYSIFFFGIALAPLYTPHLNERFGRLPVYVFSVPLMGLFTLGASAAHNFATLVVCRFFAGLFGGPLVVLIEGTFADLWSAEQTVTYYSFIALSQYLGAASGAVVLDHLVPDLGFRWTQWVPLIFVLATLLLLIGFNETFPRELIRREAKRAGRPHNLPQALTGVTFAQMANLTVVQPIILLFSNVVVTGITLALAFNFGVLFALFIAVPGGLMKAYNFDQQRIGNAFIAAIGGAVAAAVTSILIDQAFFFRNRKRGEKDVTKIEHRLVPGIIGGVFMTASLFWMAWTLKPTITFNAPIVASAFYVWGSMMMLTSLVSYLFDAFTAPGTLASLTSAAVARVTLAGVIPLVIVQLVTNLGVGWGLSLLGFISAGLMFVPVFLLFFGHRIRMTSKFAPSAEEHGMMAGMGGMGGMEEPPEMSSDGSTAYNGGSFSNGAVGDAAA